MADFQTTVEKIKSRGYWQVRLYPSQVQENLIEPVSKAKELVQSSGIHLRGWDYPHFPTQKREHQDIYVGEHDSIEAWIDWAQYKEIWRFYTNGQFIHLFGLREDWWGEHAWLDENNPLKKINPGEVLEVISTVYSLTEIYAFFSNIIQDLPVESFTVEISLIGVKDRQLYVHDFNRAPLWGDYSYHFDKIVLPKRVYEKDELIKNFSELAFEQIVYIFHKFGWSDPNIPVIKEDQKKLLERRI